MKDTNIRIKIADYRLLSRIAKKEGRTILGQFRTIVQEYYLRSLKK
jgi:hypothetical protein